MRPRHGFFFFFFFGALLCKPGRAPKGVTKKLWKISLNKAQPGTFVTIHQRWPVSHESKGKTRLALCSASVNPFSGNLSATVFRFNLITAQCTQKSTTSTYSVNPNLRQWVPNRHEPHPLKKKKKRLSSIQDFFLTKENNIFFFKWLGIILTSAFGLFYFTNYRSLRGSNL